MRAYYDQLHGELVKLYKEFSKAAECFVGGEYSYSGRDWITGEYCYVSLFESINYAHWIVLSKEWDKQRKEELDPFPPDKK